MRTERPLLTTIARPMRKATRMVRKSIGSKRVMKPDMPTSMTIAPTIGIRPAETMFFTTLTSTLALERRSALFARSCAATVRLR